MFFHFIHSFHLILNIFKIHPSSSNDFDLFIEQIEANDFDIASGYN
jgi:hypothetical protein